jgi:hypothetical protein
MRVGSAFLIMARKAQAQQVLLPKTARPKCPARLLGPRWDTRWSTHTTVGPVSPYVTGQNGNVPGWNGGTLPMG